MGMAAVQETVDRVKSLDVTEYKYGFFSRDRDRTRPRRALNEDIVRFISAKKNEPEWLTEWRLDAYRRWLTMQEPVWARVDYRQDRLPGSLLLCRAQDSVRPEDARRRRSRAAEVLREARHPVARAGTARRRRGRAAAPRRRRRGLRFGLGGDHVQGRARQVRRDLLPDLGSGAQPSRAGEEVPRLRRADDRQLLRDAECGRLLRRLVRLHPAGRALPDGVVDLLPHQREEYRPVRAHADHRRQGRLRLLSRRMHGAAARREPAARRRGRARHARRRRDQVLDGAELVSRRRRGQGRHLQLRDQARRLPRQELEDLVDAGRDRLGDHLEVPVLHPARRRIRAASSTPSPSPTAISRSIPAPR